MTAGPAAATQATTAPVLPAVFRGSVAADLGIEMPMVQAGQAVYPAVTASATAAPAAKATARNATAATITPSTVEPRRITGRIVWRKEDAALLSDLDTALVSDLSAVLVDAFDDQIVNGDGSAPNLRGLATQLPLPAAATDAAATTFGKLVERAASAVDGLYSNSFRDCRLCMSVEAHAYLDEPLPGQHVGHVGARLAGKTLPKPQGIRAHRTG